MSACERHTYFDGLGGGLADTILTRFADEYLRVMYSSNLKAGKAFGQASLAAGGGLGECINASASLRSPKRVRALTRTLSYSARVADVPDKKRQPAFVLDESFENSPRRHHLHEAAKTAVEGTSSAANNGDAGDADTSLIQVGGGGGDAVGGRGGSSSSVGPQPLPLLMTTFRHYGGEDLSEEFFRRLVKYFEQVKVPRGEVLWCEGDEADGCESLLIYCFSPPCALTSVLGGNA